MRHPSLSPIHLSYPRSRQAPGRHQRCHSGWVWVWVWVWYPCLTPGAGRPQDGIHTTIQGESESESEFESESESDTPVLPQEQAGPRTSSTLPFRVSLSLSLSLIPLSYPGAGRPQDGIHAAIQGESESESESHMQNRTKIDSARSFFRGKPGSKP